MKHQLRVVAVDDEALALRRLELLVPRIAGATLVGTARSGREALALIAEERPDVVLLDIKMGTMDGFEVVKLIDGPHVPLVIFVTAYDSFAVRAFEVRAVDYVLKPVEFDRLEAALDKARQSLAAADAEVRAAELKALVAALRSQAGPTTSGPRYETEFWAERRGDFVRVRVADINWIEAERDYVRLHTAGHAYLLRETISGMQGRLDPEQFLRVRRSALVRIDRVQGIRRAGYGNYRVALTSGEDVRVGRTYVKSIRALIAPHRVEAEEA